MKTLKLALLTLLFFAAFTSCSDDADDPLLPESNPLEEYNMLTTIKANGHEIEIYSEDQQFSIGYNELLVRIKDEAAETYLSDVEISWMPIMHMTTMMHSCPKSLIAKTNDASVYKGYIVFQMPGNSEEYWDLGFEYIIEGQMYEAKNRIEVKLPLDGKKKVSSFMANDDSRYIVAMMPLKPEVAINDFNAMVFKMENMMSFPSVANYKIAIDPRMPGMGNHSSPNNEDLAYDASTEMYKGKLSLTMTGYWKINLKLMNEGDEVLKGESVTDENESSSLFFELEF